MKNLSPQLIESTKKHLSDMFGFSNVEDLISISHEYKSLNYKVTADGQKFFLKEYRGRMNETVHEIKMAEEFFSARGLPVILSLRDRHSRTAFKMHGSWWSLFPYVEGKSPTIPLNDQQLSSLGRISARLHFIGVQAPLYNYQMIRLWQREEFFWEYAELIDELNKRKQWGEKEHRVFDMLKKKKNILENESIESTEIPQRNLCLIHGDLIYQNVYVDDMGEITHLYDFEKTCIAPRAYEVARSLMINCFDDGWGKTNIAMAQTFIDSYQAVFPIGFDEFLMGVRLYWMNMVQMTWLEYRELYDKEGDPNLIKRHSERLNHLSEKPEDFCHQVLSHN